MKKYQWVDYEETQWFNIFMTSVFEDKHSLKISDSLLLNDNSNSTWEKWVSKMQMKLSVNENHYCTNNVCIKYLLSQLSEKVTQHIKSHHLYKLSVLNLYCTTDKILKNLKKIYENLNKSQNYCWVYIELV